MGGGPAPTLDDDHDSINLPDAQSMRQLKTYHALCNSYAAPLRDLRALPQAKNRILGHKPGDWIKEVGGITAADYYIPELITLLLVGHEGSGKTTLANLIARAFERDGHDRVPSNYGQVSYNPTKTETCFLREYLIPDKSKASSLCVYDTPSLSSDLTLNYKMLERWMTKGVRHGTVFDDCDYECWAMNGEIKRIGRNEIFSPFCRRNVNFVIFVVSGISILESMAGNDDSFIDSLHATFRFRFLSFKDNRPAVVVTYCDLLTSADRARVQTYLGEQLGIPPVEQIFEIPGKTDYDTELAIMDLLQYSIEQADRNIPAKPYYLVKAQKIMRRLDEQLPQLDLLIIAFCLSLLLLRLILKYF